MINIDKLAIFILFISGLLLYLPEGFLFSFNLPLICLLIGLIGLTACYWWKKKALNRVLNHSICMLLCAIWLHQPAHHLLALARIPGAVPSEIHMEFVVEEILHQQDYQTAIIRARLRPELAEQRIFLNWHLPEPLQAGQKWRAVLKIKPLSSRLNKGGFDKQQWYFSKGITAWASVTGSNGQSAVLIERVLSFRQQKLQAALVQTQGLSLQGLLIALGFGERAWLTSAIWQTYQRTNTAHLIAISGLHIGLAMAMGMLFGRGVQLLLPARRISPVLPLLCGMGLAFVYSYLAGFSIPTSRALLALVLLCGLRLWRGYCTVWQLFIRVVAILLLLDPVMVLSNSFWLSVGAVFSLILWYQFFPLQLIEWKGKSLDAVLPKPVFWILNLLHLQLGLFVLFMPVQWLFFHGFSAYGLVTNLLVVPLFSFLIVPLILFALFSNGAFSSWQMANFLAEMVTHGLALIEDHWITMSVEMSFFGTALFIAAFLFLMRLVYRKREKAAVQPLYVKPPNIAFKTERRLSPTLQRSVMFSGVSVILYCLTHIFYTYWNTPLWKLETLDVGQGLATLVVKNKHAVLYDTGAGWRNGSMAQLEILPYLQREGIVPDWLVVSHDDNDHAGGAADVLKAYPQIRFISSSTKEYAEQNSQNQHRTWCKAGAVWYWQGVKFSVLSPDKIVDRAKNTDSCILLLDDGTYRILLTGDADVAAEQRILTKLNKIDVLQVGHHGSRTSTGEALLQVTRPDIALISSGRRNRWRFPHQEVVERLNRRQSAVLNTAVSGQISVWFYPRRIEIKAQRNQFNPWYQTQID
ncbi:DNA internalization-related competence protein ComEC/Rec2 [Pasteurellaceae bacterium LIM206]|nr:DNA internalization-related competence protein ComEC/Rec2 [Pasteurellaceae bacterium LIM206]